MHREYSEKKNWTNLNQVGTYYVIYVYLKFENLETEIETGFINLNQNR